MYVKNTSHGFVCRWWWKRADMHELTRDDAVIHPWECKRGLSIDGRIVII
jgi:hypothetical protein